MSAVSGRALSKYLEAWGNKGEPGEALCREHRRAAFGGGNTGPAEKGHAARSKNLCKPNEKMHTNSGSAVSGEGASRSG